MKTLIVVDMQNDFIDGSLGTKEALLIVDKVKEKIEQRKREGYEIIFTLDTHNEDYLSTREGRFLPVPHCIKNTKGHKISERLNTENSLVFEKNTFMSKNLGEYLEKRSPKKIELVGLCTDICIVSNALYLKGLFPEAEISVDESCCAGVTKESHDAAILTMKMCQIIIE